MADTQTQNQTNEANQHQPSKTNDAPSPMPHTDPASKAEPSGYRGNNPSTSGSGQTGVSSGVPERKQGQLNPSSPGETGTTPGSNGV